MRSTAAALVSIVPYLVGFSPLRWVDPAVGANREGNQHYEAGRFEDAAKSYSHGVAADPGRPELLYNLGNSLERLGKHSEASAAYRQALENVPQRLAPDAWYNLGNSLLAAGRGKEAAQAYREALVRNPSHEDAKRNLELALEQAKKEPPEPNQGGSGKDEEQQKSTGDREQDRQRDPQTAKNDAEDREQSETPPRDPRAEPQRRSDSPDQPAAPQPEPGEEPKPVQTPPDESRAEERGDPETPSAQPEGDERELTRDQAEGLLRSFEQMERRQLQESHPPKDSGLGIGGRDW